MGFSFSVDELRELGAVFVEEISEIPSGSTVIYSAHGVSKEVQSQSEIIDLNIYKVFLFLMLF